MPKPTLQNRKYFKSYLKRYRDRFTSGIQTCQVSDISDMFSSTVAGLSTSQSVKVLLIGGNDYDAPTVVDNVFTPGSLIYFPTSAGDYVNLTIDSYNHQLYFGSEDSGITFNGNTYGIGTTFSVGTKSLTVKALGGALVETQNGPTYSVGVSTNIINEGDSVTFTVTTTGISSGTTLYYTTNGPVSAADFSNNSLTGSFVVNNNTGTIVRTLADDEIFENEDFLLQIRTTSINGSIVAESEIVTINNVDKIYSVGVSTTIINEGGTVNFTVNTTNVGSGATLYYSTSGTLSSDDFVDNSLTGSFNIIGIGATTGIATISRVLFNDGSSENTEYFTLSIRTGSTSGSVVATSSSITVLNIDPSYSLGVSTTSVNEGGSVNFTINTLNVGAGTTLYYSTNGTASADDFVDNSLTGSFNIIGIGATTGIATVTKTIASDIVSEGEETFEFVVRTGSTSGTVVATSSTITINNIDPVYTINQSTTSVNEGGSVNFTINTLNVGAGTTLYYSTSGTVEASDFSNNSLTGSFSVVSTGATTGIATVTRAIANDFNVEGNETFQFVVRTGSTSGTVVATSSTITVSNVLQTYSVGVSTTLVNEGSTITFTITTTSVPNGTTFYYTTTGDASSADFSNNSLTGSFTVTNNIGTFTRTIVSDRLTEGTQQFVIQIRSNSTSGTIVGTSPTVTIRDTSLAVGQNANGLTFGPIQVNRDNGNSANTTDWYTICGIDNLPEGSKIALFIDTSGSMTQATIQASYNLLLSKLAVKNISIITVANQNEDWITPFLTDLS